MKQDLRYFNCWGWKIKMLLIDLDENRKSSNFETLFNSSSNNGKKDLFTASDKSFVI